MPHILVTNDDGVHSAGLLALAQALRRWATSASSPRTPTAAPSAGASPSTIRSTWRRSSSPTAPRPRDRRDAGGLRALRGARACIEPRPDLIVSGINLGLNLGDDVTYSGTVAPPWRGRSSGSPRSRSRRTPSNDGAADPVGRPRLRLPRRARRSPPPSRPRAGAGLPRAGRPQHQRAGAAAGGGHGSAGHAPRPARVQRRAHAARRAGRPPPVHDLRRHRVAPAARRAPTSPRSRGRHLGHAAALQPHGPGEHGGGRGAASWPRCSTWTPPHGARDRVRPHPARPGRHGDRLRGAHPRVPPPRRADRAGRGLGGRAPRRQRRPAPHRADGGVRRRPGPGAVRRLPRVEPRQHRPRCCSPTRGSRRRCAS